MHVDHQRLLGLPGFVALFLKLEFDRVGIDEGDDEGEAQIAFGLVLCRLDLRGLHVIERALEFMGFAAALLFHTVALCHEQTQQEFGAVDGDITRLQRGFRGFGFSQNKALQT